jgi:ABC-type uncharacterized transport system YnjBCD ATPase subunit
MGQAARVVLMRALVAHDRQWLLTPPQKGQFAGLRH